MRYAGRLKSMWSRVGAKLEQWDGSGASEADGSGVLHRWLPIAIVLVSVGAATMGWQASVADERATQKDDLSRQDLMLQQQVRVRKVQEVDSDLRLFGEVERHFLLADAIEYQAHLSGVQESSQLKSEAENNREMATTLDSQLRYPDAVEAGTTVSYNVGSALRDAEAGDRYLSSLEPNRLRGEAVFQRRRGLELVGLAVLFIVALVFFTLASVTSGRDSNGESTLRSSGRAKLKQLLSGPEAAAYCLTGAGATATAAVLVLFVLVRLV